MNGYEITMRITFEGTMKRTMPIAVEVTEPPQEIIEQAPKEINKKKWYKSNILTEFFLELRKCNRNLFGIAFYGRYRPRKENQKTVKKDSTKQPNGQWKVNRKDAMSGNPIRYDSGYNYSYSNTDSIPFS